MSTAPENSPREDFLHYVWKFSLFERHNLQTSDGQQLEIQATGEYNHDAGPDFVNARVKIGDTLWAGNVEIHRRSSDWLRHHHHTDKTYDTVVLHVVEDDDTPVTRTCGTTIPALVMRFNVAMLDTYEQLLRSKRWVFCEEQFDTVPDVIVSMWLERLLVERVESKTLVLEETLVATHNDWHVAFYHVLARSLGTNVNADAFQLLATSLPLQVLARYTSNIVQLEALLFGQSGLLQTAATDDYVQLLRSEYAFLAQKHQLSPLSPGMWKFMRMRPMNFPTIRIAQLAQLLYVSSGLLSKVIASEDIDSMRRLFDVSVSGYWTTHYTFGKESAHQSKHMGVMAINTILINTVIPFIFEYGKKHGQEALVEKALSFLSSIPFEVNEVTGRWKDKIHDCNSAARSQALIHLDKQYCKKGKCLHCAVGSHIVRKAV